MLSIPSAIKVHAVKPIRAAYVGDKTTATINVLHPKIIDKESYLCEMGKRERVRLRSVDL